MQEKIHFRNRLMRLRINNDITKEEYNTISKLTLTMLDEDFELAKQLLRVILITS